MRNFLFINSFENEAVNSLLYAAKFAKLANADLQILHLVPEKLNPLILSSSMYLLSSRNEDYLKELDERENKKIGDIKEKIELVTSEHLPIDWTIDKIVKDELLESINQKSKKNKLDLIIIGNDLASTKGKQELLEDLINDSEVPILLIPSFQKFVTPKRWMFLSDYSFDDIDHIQLLKQWMGNIKSEIVVTHINKRGEEEETDQEKYFVRNTLKAWESVWGQKRIKLNLNEITEDVSIEKYIELEFNDFVVEYDFLCLTTKKRNFWQELVSYSTSIRIAKNMVVPVMIFRK